MGKDSKTTLRGRSARTGQFTKVEKVCEYSIIHVVERVPKPVYGDKTKK